MSNKNPLETPLSELKNDEMRSDKAVQLPAKEEKQTPYSQLTYEEKILRNQEEIKRNVNYFAVVLTIFLILSGIGAIVVLFAWLGFKF